ncbi:MAG: DUF4347 domain-containing protein [Microcystis sp. M53603_WE2]|jgi:hypothetical protein|uniref:DUF4347 domain-containing protein n=1 Tax=unclassified Microcystis TaxID=2643300 RepID=UPI0025887B20|nr:MULTISPECIES: DUF4347 domain-containing protein [unclassified Microcystis]MDJ0539409.1 DUF4347 domain-containing protein [Microcystis sp. M53603_WE2]MDJ0564996.1 DUF4347 domain-containing protein [Microcystis sp. M49629_WE12]MDJ0602247.1 DUF4347 domain-containing protein [Microcystis sp. M53602_WE12]
MTSTLLPGFPAVDDVLFNFAQSDGLSQANRVDSARNQRLTATLVFLDAGVSDYQSLQAGVIPEVATVILSPNEDGIEQITAFLQQNPQITTTTSIIKSVRYAIALHSLRVSKQLQ